MILDRYLLRQFIQIFLICFLSLTGLYVVIDVFSHLDDFSAYADKQGSLLKTLGVFYGPRALGFFDRISGILAMLAAMFTVTWLQRHQELTAMLAAGISKFRVIKPIVIAAVVVSLLGVANREFLIPQFRDQLTRDIEDLNGTESQEMEARFDGRTNILIGGQQTVAAEKRIIKPTFVMPGELSQYGKQFRAKDAFFVSAGELHPAGYLLDGVTQPARIDKLNTLTLKDQPVLITPKDAAWLEPDQVFVVSQVRFEILASGSAWRDYASTGELITELGNPTINLGPDVQIAVHSRILKPVMDGTLLMLGLPLMLTRGNRNIFLSFGLCLLVAAGFSMVTLAGESLGGLSMLRPTLAAWLPVLVFLPIAAAISGSLRT